MSEAGIGARVEDARLVVTELATNAVVHAQSGFEVVVGLRGRHLEISVDDASSELPAPALEVGPDRTGGRGLPIISRLAEQWGVEPTPAGKRIWVRLALDPDRSVLGCSPGR